MKDWLALMDKTFPAAQTKGINTVSSAGEHGKTESQQEKAKLLSAPSGHFLKVITIMLWQTAERDRSQITTKDRGSGSSETMT